MTHSKQPMSLSVDTADGYQLSASLFEDKNVAQKGRVVICSAVGTPKEYYRHFASWLASQGYPALTFDYRGFRESSDLESLKKITADATMMGQYDITSAIQSQRHTAPEVPLYVVAHSLGGHLLGLAENSQEITSVTTLTSGSGYWRHWPFPKSIKRGFLWYVMLPVLSHLCGYFPGKARGWSTNLPKRAALEWARWCRHPDYMLHRDGRSIKSTGGFDHFNAPVLGMSFSDDSVISKSAIDALHSLYTSAQVTRRHLTPESLGVEQVGHFGFFRPSCRDIWPLAIDGFVPASPSHNCHDGIATKDTHIELGG